MHVSFKSAEDQFTVYSTINSWLVARDKQFAFQAEAAKLAQQIFTTLREEAALPKDASSVVVTRLSKGTAQPASRDTGSYTFQESTTDNPSLSAKAKSKLAPSLALEGVSQDPCKNST